MKKIKTVPVTKRELLKIIEETQTGVIFLEGPSASGKTHLLKEAQAASERTVKIISYETVAEAVIRDMTKRCYNTEQFAKSLSADIICIEDIDFLHGREQMQTELAYLANRLGENSLIIFTGIDMIRRVPGIFVKLHDFICCSISRD